MSKRTPTDRPSPSRKRISGKASPKKRHRDAVGGGRKRSMEAASIVTLLREEKRALTKNEIARALDVPVEAKQELRHVLAILVAERVIEARGARFALPSQLPEVLVVKVHGLTHDGEPIARPVEWQGEGDAPDIIVTKDKLSKGSAPGVGERALVRLRVQEGANALAVLIRTLPKAADQSVLGMLRRIDGKLMLESTDKRGDAHYQIVPGDVEAAEGDFVRAMITRARPERGASRRHLGVQEAKIVERLGAADAPKAVSLISIHTHDLPFAFPPAVEAEAEDLPEPIMSPSSRKSGARVDLREIPLVTIDGEDARDFDDAVFAEPDTDPTNKGGWHLLVAIADVSYYVKTGNALDVEAKTRGNSVYFPDRVVPMLPERLSNGLCSLRPHEDRYCLAIHLWIDAQGHLLRHKLVRGIMRSVARLTYMQVQAAHDGQPDDVTRPLMDHVIKPLYQAFRLRDKQRGLRGALAIELPEYKIELDDNDTVKSIAPRPRCDSHRLIEEFMILANVAAAQMLRSKKAPALLRVHETPEHGKIRDLGEFLAGFGLELFRGDGIQARHFNQIFQKVEGLPIAHIIHTAVLRSQMQAYYGPQAYGHFGLALKDYAHFTSPIRRYSDLIVHRALIKAYDLGDDGLTEEESRELAEIGEHISFTERRAMQAERDARERYTVAYLRARLGEQAIGHISGMARAGLFIALEGTGADGFIPLGSLKQDYFVFDERAKVMRGRRTGMSLHLGDKLVTRIEEANALTGRLRLELLEVLASPGGGYQAEGKASKSSERFKMRGRKEGDKPERHGPRKGSKHKGPKRKEGSTGGGPKKNGGKRKR